MTKDEAIKIIQTEMECVNRPDCDRLACAYCDLAMRAENILTAYQMALTALQTDGDCISRQEAIRIASGYCHPANVAKELAKLPSVQPEPHYTDDQIQKMQDLEQAQLDKAFELGRKDAKWIPCSKRLPEETEARYWVCTDGGYQCQCRWTNDVFGLGEGDTWTWKIFDIPQYSKVIAWMKLPEPWKEGEK